MQSVKYIPISEAGQHFPVSPSRSTISRYINGGLDGVRLRVVRSVGRVFTTAEWIQEFIEATSEQTPRQSLRRSRRVKRSIRPRQVSESERANAEASLSGS